MNIIKYGNDALYKESAPVEESKIDDVVDTANEMIEFLEGKNGGVGLSAVQVGILKTFFVMRVKNSFWEIVINPEIISQRGSEKSIEGCISNPGVYGIVKRARKIKVKYLDVNFKEKYQTLKQTDAFIFQHEYDHTTGVCCWDKFEKRIR